MAGGCVVIGGPWVCSDITRPAGQSRGGPLRDLVVLVFGDEEAALERTRDQLGNGFMRAYVIPHAAGPPERSVTEVIRSYQRPSGAQDGD